MHILLEVPPLAAGRLSDEELLKRLGGIYGGAEVAEVARELREARQKVRAGLAAESLVEAIHQRFTYRMNDLGQFMKTLLQRFTRWFNRKNERTGTLWESRFKSVLVEEGVAARMMAAYIDLNPVRAGMVTDPADYRWSSYGEAMAGGKKGDGKKARAGLVRAIMAHKGYEADARHWPGRISAEYRAILLEPAAQTHLDGGDEGTTAVARAPHKGRKKPVGEAPAGSAEAGGEVAMDRMLRSRVRYFSDGAVVGSREFVNEVFRLDRDRFSEKRKDGARKRRGSGAAAAGTLWSARDLHKDIG